MLCLRGVQEGGELLEVGDVERDGDGGAADLGGDPGGGVGIDIANGDVRSGAGEMTNDGAADPGAGAGDRH